MIWLFLYSLFHLIQEESSIFSIVLNEWISQYLLSTFTGFSLVLLFRTSIRRIWSCFRLWGILQIVEERRIRDWKKLEKNMRWFIILSVLGALGDGRRHRVFKEMEVNLDLGAVWIWIGPRRLCWARQHGRGRMRDVWTRRKLWGVGAAQLDRWGQDYKVVYSW